MIEVDDAGPIWTITLNRPSKANALTAQMLSDLADVAERAASARAVILTGVGKVFSAGADLDAAKAGLATSPDWERLSGAIAALPGLTVAALNGTLAGGATGMALACDIRIAVPRASFFYPVMKLGYLPQPSDPLRMAALIGPARTKMVFAAGQKLGAQTALAYGLIDEIVEDEDVMVRALALCADVAAADPVHAQKIKAMCANMQ
ncbi:enoyl-CoA hydratase/isomerase family protein [uncultured Tateyamaria sp.]|uniref:enoyl-CoA hydratase/isomerase family protein n=1 Tax=uncultured Tateyamaria sp. TaxID=455651 RepID=UPI0026292333|nr:enoyl-CoA hydratase/isomerase family protein [uncultured Tateyamaria sp.]